jgi:hypothetical protein
MNYNPGATAVGSPKLAVLLALGLPGLMTGCGTFVPGLEEFYDPQDTKTLADAVVYHVQCEVQTEIQSLLIRDQDIAAAKIPVGREHRPQGPRLDWLKTWGAQAILTLTVDEKSSLNPGVTLNTVLPNATTVFSNGNVTTPQSFSLGLGAGVSAAATRKEMVAWFIDFKNFTSGKALARARAMGIGDRPAPCSEHKGILIQSDLRLREWLYAVVLPTVPQDAFISGFKEALATEAKASKKDVISHEITFAIQYNANATPSWKLVRVSANQGSSPLFNFQRTRTQNLLITMGPTTPAGPTQAQQNAALASQIGIAVANAIKNSQ